MKILHVLYSGLGGHGNVFFSMVNADEKKEFIYEALFNGIEDVRLTYIEKCKAFGIKWNFVKKKFLTDINYYLRVAKIIKNSDAEIIFLHSSAYIFQVKLATLFSNKKIIVRETQPNHIKTKKEWIGLFMAFLLADKIAFLSEEYRAEIEKKLSLVYSKDKVAVIPNGIDLTLFQPQQKSHKDFILIGMQSRLSPTKDHTTLLHAFALLKARGHKNIRLKLAGDGVCKPDLIILSQQLKIDNDVEFTGMLEERSLVSFLNELDIYIHASLGETMSTAIMQAMACRLPIIASDVPGVNNMIKHNTSGILVPAKNKIIMADAIESFLNNTQEAQKLAGKALLFAQQNYSNTTMFNLYKALFYK
jgi:glycosyltransferase involved in cell wall biosynthesis